MRMEDAHVCMTQPHGLTNALLHFLTGKIHIQLVFQAGLEKKVHEN